MLGIKSDGKKNKVLHKLKLSKSVNSKKRYSSISKLIYYLERVYTL